MKATRIKVYGTNFALYRIDEPIDCRVYDDNGKDCALPSQIIGVHQMDFCGWAGGKTGKHAFSADNTKVIDIIGIKVHSDGKTNARWILTNQEEVNKLYGQLVRFNI